MALDMYIIRDSQPIYQDVKLNKYKTYKTEDYYFFVLCVNIET